MKSETDPWRKSAMVMYVFVIGNRQNAAYFEYLSHLLMTERKLYRKMFSELTVTTWTMRWKNLIDHAPVNRPRKT